MSKKNKNKEVLNLPIANSITIQMIDPIYPDMTQTPLFKLYIKNSLLNKLLKLNNMFEISLFSKNKSFIITATTVTSESFMLNEESQIKITQIEEEIEKLKISDTKENDNGLNILKNLVENQIKLDSAEFDQTECVGLEEYVEKVQQIFKYTINQSENTKYIYKGIVINGAPGIGKTHLVNSIIKMNYNLFKFLKIDIKELIKFEKDEYIGYISNTFKYAKILKPAVIVIEELDKLFTKDDEKDHTVFSLDDNKSKLIIRLIEEIDNLNSSDRVLLLTTTQNIDKLDNELKKSTRLDYTLTIIQPRQKERKALLLKLTKDIPNNLSDEDYEVLADKSHGFVAGDLIQLIKHAILNNQILTKSDMEASLKEIKPISLKDIIIDVPKVLWSDIGGNKHLVDKIRQSIEWPLKHPEAFKRIGITPPNGILLYGPPGCSKTMIAKALATESGLNFFAVKGPELFSKYVGDTEKAIRDIFKKAKISSPSIIFFDEIDSMATQRGSDSHVSDKVLCQLLNEMDGIEGREKVVIFGATNRPDILDKALIRPGRFDRLIYIPQPDDDARREIFNINIKKMSVGDINIDELVNLTNNFSGAEVNLICREAGMFALNENIETEKVEENHFIKAISMIKPIITAEMIEYFENFSKKIEI